MTEDGGAIEGDPDASALSSRASLVLRGRAARVLPRLLEQRG